MNFFEIVLCPYWIDEKNDQEDTIQILSVLSDLTIRGSSPIYRSLLIKTSYLHEIILK